MSNFLKSFVLSVFAVVVANSAHAVPDFNPVEIIEQQSEETVSYFEMLEISSIVAQLYPELLPVSLRGVTGGQGVDFYVDWNGNCEQDITVTSVEAPATLGLLLVGLGAMLHVRRRERKEV